MRYSNNCKEWVAQIDIKTCLQCREKHGKIYDIDKPIRPKPPLHMYCRCSVQKMKMILAGKATNNEKSGADWCLKYTGELPCYYIDIDTAGAMGWSARKGNLSDVAPGCMIFGGVFNNTEKKLPIKSGRIWYEADINYTTGYRNDERILFSNDGLIFVTYDHYTTFIEIQ